MRRCGFASGEVRKITSIAAPRLARCRTRSTACASSASWRQALDGHRPTCAAVAMIGRSPARRREGRTGEGQARCHREHVTKGLIGRATTSARRTISSRVAEVGRVHDPLAQGRAVRRPSLMAKVERRPRTKDKNRSRLVAPVDDPATISSRHDRGATTAATRAGLCQRPDGRAQAR